MSNKGYIYILVNPSFINLLKIGATNRTSEIRAKEISQQGKTGIPTRFLVAYDQQVSDCFLVEKKVHEELKKYRLSVNNEFFDISLKLAIATIQKVVQKLENQHEIEIVVPEKEKEKSSQDWWNDLSFIWQQIFRLHLNLTYQPNEIELLSAVHSIIDYSQDVKLRSKIAELIVQKNFTQQLNKWYNNLADKRIFNTYLPYLPTLNEIDELFKIEKIDCGNSISILDFEPLERFSQLKELNAINTSVSNLEPLKMLSNLEIINLNYTKIDTLEPIIKLKNLKKVFCYGTELTTKQIKDFQIKQSHCKLIDDIFLSSVPPQKNK